MRFTWLGFVLLCCLSISAAPSATSGTLKIPASSTFKGKPITLIGHFRSIGDRNPVVILLHGCSGLESVVKSALRNHASALRKAGFSTLILDSFTPRGISGGWVCKREGRLANAQTYRQRDVRDAVKHLTAENLVDPSNIFIMGQSNGGSVTALIARNRIKGVRAAVAYYPWCGVVTANPAVPLLVLSGEEDDWTPPARCNQIDKPGGNLKVVTYPGAVHSFDLNIPVQSYQGHKVGGNPGARNDSRKRMASFFKAHLTR